ncbi:uncharacterized protein LOC108912084 isoform X2 [Anoplophora glabripennis]|uniref:uncharacterized protein LOC108912084 isoform X2 n=1 Tax=Anoplophora glabripennis TaxID=217634 RepID=UPI0008757816|nr:uncharacterized protein LOC108912084 isoform X2 [Anoplophora glabripennis]
MSVQTTQDIFEIVPLIQNINVKLCARCENGVKQILALITGDGDIVLHYTYGELTPVLKRVPWFTDNHKLIQAICFDPSATWLLVVSIDCSLYIIPALNLVDKRQKIDCKWSLNDITHFPKHFQIPEAKPTSVVWWQTLDCNQNALVGFENGTIVLISLTDGRCLGSCNITESVTQLCLCQDNSLETVSLLINGVSGQQWRLILEHHSTGYVWPPDANTQVDESGRSRLYNLKQLGVDKLASLKQRLSEARGGRRDSQTSDTASESSHSESNHSTQSGPELLPHLCDTFFAPQNARNRYLFSAFYRPTSLLTVHAVDVESAPLYVHKLPQKTAEVLLTDKLIYTINSEYNTVSIISSQLSECRLEGDAEFNNDSVVAQFYMEKETIQQFFKLVDLSSVRLRKNREENKKDKLYELPKTVDDLNIQKPRIDTCVIVTDSSIYKVALRCSPIKRFIEYITEENDLDKAERLSYIFGLNIQQLLEGCGDLLISKGSYHSGIILYKQAKVHLLKRVLKLAVSADCKTLLKFVHLCLSASKVDMSIATKIHIGNLAVMAYTELILRYGGQQRITNTRDFMNFLCYEEYYDQILAVNVACQAGHWNVVTLLAKSRGLQPEVVSALGQILQSARAPRPTDFDFLYALSEPNLTQSLLVLGQSSQIIFQYIRTNIDTFPLQILQRLAAQLDPSQPCAIPLVNRLFHTNKYSSSLDTTIESVDFENPDRGIIIAKDLIDTFLSVVIYLTHKSEKTGFNLSLLDNVGLPDNLQTEIPIKKLPDLHPLSCGFEHAAVVRNSQVYTMGVSSSGCLGLGPLLTQSSPPRLVVTLSELKVKVLSISCGRKHTLALTDYGVYSWGSNAYGQLGLGHFVQESPYPQILSSIASVKIIDVAAGQYHSIALTSTGKVYTWGWGIHGQLGHGNCDNEFYPKLINFPHPVKQVSAGHAHSLILTCEGKLYGFGSNVFGQLESCQIDSNKSARPVWVLLMPDIYTPIEKVATAYFHNTVLGRPLEEDNRKLEGKVLVFKNTRRVIKFPNALQGNSDNFPIEVPGLPSMAITFNPTDQKLLFSKNYIPYSIRALENNQVLFEETHLTKSTPFSDHIYDCPKLKYGQKTLHYILQTYFGFYDTDNILSRCLEVHNYQAAAKIAMLDGHFSDSLGFQLIAFKKHIDTLNLNLNSACVKKSFSELKEKDEGYVELIVRNIQDDLNEKNLIHSNSGDKMCNSPAHLLSSSSSLDSIRQWGDDIEHQGGCESPCEMSDMGDIRQNITQYVQSLKNNENSPPILSVSKMISDIDNDETTKIKDENVHLQIKDKSAKEVIDAASSVIEFYIKKIYVSENHILMQNVLLKCIEFWLSNNLPVPVLENVLLKNMDKYFYPLSILLFCKNFGNNLDDELIKDDSNMKPTSSGFLKEFSTKFCLQLCSMVLENVNKS